MIIWTDYHYFIVIDLYNLAGNTGCAWHFPELITNANAKNDCSIGVFPCDRFIWVLICKSVPIIFLGGSEQMENGGMSNLQANNQTFWEFFGKLSTNFWDILRKIWEIFKNLLRNFQEVRASTEKWESFEIFCNFSESFEKVLRNGKVSRNFWGNFWEISHHIFMHL